MHDFLAMTGILTLIAIAVAVAWGAVVLAVVGMSCAVHFACPF